MRHLLRILLTAICIALLTAQCLADDAAGQDEPAQQETAARNEAQEPYPIYGVESGVEGLIIPSGWLQKGQLGIAKELPQLVALDIAFWDFYQWSINVPEILEGGFTQSEDGCRVYRDSAYEGEEWLECYRNGAQELEAQLIGKVSTPIEYTSIMTEFMPLATYIEIPCEIATHDEVLRYYQHVHPAEVPKEEKWIPEHLEYLAMLESLAGEGCTAWFTDMLGIVVYPEDEDGSTGVEFLSGEPLSYYLTDKLGRLDR